MDDLTNSSILVTGGVGCIGISIVKCFQQRYPSSRISVVDLQLPSEDQDDPRRIQGVEYYKANMIDYSAMLSVVQKVRPDVVVHTASLIPPAARKLGLFHFGEDGIKSVNVDGTRNVINAAKEAGTVKAFVFTSSADAVKGNSWEDLTNVNEDMPYPTTWDSPYAESKVCTTFHIVIPTHYLTYMNKIGTR